MEKFKLLLMIVVINLLSFEHAIAKTNASGLFGSYVGVMKHSKVSKDQFAKLDFIISREDGNTFELMAVLSVYFGDFGSSEYVSYHFDKVKYNLITGILVFDQTDQDVTLITNTFGNGQIEATVRSSISGNVGKILLQQDGAASPTRQHILSVAGKYEGSCDGVSTTLQLNTYKSTVDTLRLGNPFGSYEVNGQLGDHNTFICPNAKKKPCTTDLIYSGSYDYFSGDLTLFGKRNSYECRVDGDSLRCGQCSFIKMIGDSDSGEVKKPITSVNKIEPVDLSENSALIGKSSSISGEYKGYLHHERLDQYQAGSLNIVTYQDSNGGQGLKMSAVANLYFGGFESQERVPYKFKPRDYNLLSKVFVFERAEADVDAVLQVTEIGAGVVKGVWYSILFGRVGTFYFTTDKISDLPEDAKVFKKIAGDYESPKFFLRVGTRLNSSPVNTENPFYPQVFSGRFLYKSGIAARINITGGSYDFYTGKLAFDIRDGERVAIGENKSNDLTMNLKWPTKVISSILPDYTTEAFTK